MNKFANVQEAAQAHFSVIKNYLVHTPESINLEDLPDNFIDLLVAIGDIYAAEVDEYSSLKEYIPELDRDAVTLSDAFYYCLMAMFAVDVVIMTP